MPRLPAAVCLCAALLCGLVAPVAATADDADPAAVRERFKETYRRLDAGEPLVLPDDPALRAHPLYPYLEAAALRRRLAVPTADVDAEIEAFLTRHGAEPVARSLRRSWLGSLATRRQWERFLGAYRPELDDTRVLRCQALAARVALDRGEGLEREALDAWLEPTSAPGECDPAFAWLEARGALTPELRERRARLALAAGESGLARHLAQKLPARRAAPLVQWASLIENPQAAVDALLATPAREVEPAALLDGWTRLARRDADGAAARFDDLVRARGLDERAASPYALAVALGLSWSRHAAALPWFAQARLEDYDERAHEWRVRAALWAGDWTLVARAIEAMPPALREQNRWRYWAARAAQQLGDTAQARSRYEAVIPTDNWYAALAAARLGRSFEPQLQPLAIDPAAVDRLAAQPAFVRARELDLCGLDELAAAEWRHAYELLTPQQQLQAVGLAARYGWHLQAIAAAARLGLFNDYELLYPRPFDAEVRGAATLTRLPESLIYAIIRQESLYRADARSSANALGLMQLLPETARRTARRWDLPEPTRAGLLQPAVNIPLGAAFLRSLMDRADGQAPLAIAGYNAGPGAARRWLADRPVETDVWVENIPFNETRAYVQRVAWHALVFDWLATRKPREVTPLLGSVHRPAADAALQPAG